jgi:glycosyltransferase involved in cell wall biosynthesis
MSAPVRLTAVLTHPIQYYSPWFRHLHAHAPEVELTVLHATEPTAEQQGVGFERAFAWDVPLTEGFRSITVRPAKPGDRIDSSRFTGLDVKEIGDAIERTRPDVVLITGWYSMTLVRALLACRRLGVPALYRGDTNLLSQPRGWRRPLAALKTRWLLRRFAGFLSPGVRSTSFLRHYGAPDHRIFRAPHAVDNEMFAAAAAKVQQRADRAAARLRRGLDPDAFVVLFAGKLVPFKRPVQLVRAVARLGAKATLLVAGAGPLDAAMRAEAERLGVSMVMAGFMNQRELGEAYGVADCLALPSDGAETWGLVVNEALASGIPCVVSDAVGCAPDLIRDGETGYVVPLDDGEAMAAALAAVRQRTSEGFDWGPACRAVADEYDYDALTAGVVRACRSVIAHSPGAEPDWSAAAVRVVACCGGMVSAGGLERMTFEVLDVLRRNGMATHAIVNGWENFRITALADAAGASWSVGPYWYPLKRRKLTPAAVWQMVVEVSRVSLDLLRVSRQVRPTHVFLPDFYAALRNFPALLWLRLRGVCVIARLGTAPPPGRFYRQLWRWAIDPVVDRFVANSPFTRRELVAHGIDSEKIETIENVAPRRDGAPAAAVARIPGRVIFVGQVIPEKGLDLLLDALGQVRSRGVDATLDVVGTVDGWEAPNYRGHQAAIRERAARADVAGAVQFLGFSEDVPALLNRASIHCCPSRPEQREGFGIVVLEAKLSGLPSVVTPSGNLPDMIDHGRDGWSCPRADADAIAEGLLAFLTQPDLLAAAGVAARASAERYNDRRFASAWARVFAGGRSEYSHAIL